MNLLCGLGATAFNYTGVSCSELEARITRLKANMDANPKRAKDPKYQTNYANFTGEFNTRCGGAVSPYTLQPGGAFVGSGVPGLTTLGPGGVSVDAYGNPIIEEPFYSSSWFKIALIGGAVAIGLGVLAMKKRRKG